MDELDTPGRFGYEVVAEGAVTRLRLTGELDLSTTGELEEGVRDAVAGVSERLVIDASGLRFADSSAIALWVSWRNVVPAIEIQSPPPLVRRVIEAMGLAEVLHLS